MSKQRSNCSRGQSEKLRQQSKTQREIAFRKNGAIPYTRPRATYHHQDDEWRTAVTSQIFVPPWGGNGMMIVGLVRALLAEDDPCYRLGDKEPFYVQYDRVRDRILHLTPLQHSLGSKILRRAGLETKKPSQEIMTQVSKCDDPSESIQSLRQRAWNGEIDVLPLLANDHMEYCQEFIPSEFPDLRDLTQRFLCGNLAAEQILLAVAVMDNMGLDLLAMDEVHKRRMEGTKTAYGALYGPHTTKEQRRFAKRVREQLLMAGWRPMNDKTVLRRARAWVRIRYVVGLTRFTDEERERSGGEAPHRSQTWLEWIKPFDDAIGYERKRGRPKNQESDANM